MSDELQNPIPGEDSILPSLEEPTVDVPVSAPDSEVPPLASEGSPEGFIAESNNIPLSNSGENGSVAAEAPAGASAGEVSKAVFDIRGFLAGLLPKLKEKLAFRTEKRLAKIMELARKKGEIQNDDVEKLLRVSDATATNYLRKLLERGSLRASGSQKHRKYLPN